jgi:hypothetical protein
MTEEEFIEALDNKIRDAKEARTHYRCMNSPEDREWARGRQEAFEETKRLYQELNK